MRKFIYTLAKGFVLASLAFGFSPIDAQTVRTAATVEEFIHSIADNTTILLTADRYNLLDYSDTSRFLSSGLVLTKVKNLVIKAEKGAKFIISDPSSTVMMLRGCENIRIEGLELGHGAVLGDACNGCVISVFQCKNISFVNCEMYGSGYIGLSATECNGLNIEKCEMDNCSFRLLDLYDCDGIKLIENKFDNFRGDAVSQLYFEECSRLDFSNNKICELNLEWVLNQETEIHLGILEILQCVDMSFQNNDFFRNRVDTWMFPNGKCASVCLYSSIFYIKSSVQIDILNNRIEDNTGYAFLETDSPLKVEGNRFSDNYFIDLINKQEENEKFGYDPDFE